MKYSGVATYSTNQAIPTTDFGKVVIFTGGTLHTLPQAYGATASLYKRTLLVNNTSSDIGIGLTYGPDKFNINGVQVSTSWTLGAYKSAVVVLIDSSAGIYQVEGLLPPSGTAPVYTNASSYTVPLSAGYVITTYSSGGTGATITLPNPTAENLGRTVIVRGQTASTVTHTVTTVGGGNSMLAAGASSTTTSHTFNPNYSTVGRYTVMEIAGGTTYAWVGW